MLYLIRSWGRGGKSALKIGYTSDLKERMTSYRISNPGFEFISSREGDLIEEKKIQFYLEILGYKTNFLNEWFIDDPKVQTLFHQSLPKINKTLWTGRDKIWGKGDKFQGLPREIYEELVLWFPGRKKGLADKEYRRMMNLEFLKTKKIDYLSQADYL